MRAPNRRNEGTCDRWISEATSYDLWSDKTMEVEEPIVNEYGNSQMLSPNVRVIVDQTFASSTLSSKCGTTNHVAKDRSASEEKWEVRGLLRTS